VRRKTERDVAGIEDLRDVLESVEDLAIKLPGPPPRG
jgi:hypothetical protein